MWTVIESNVLHITRLTRTRRQLVFSLTFLFPFDCIVLLPDLSISCHSSSSLLHSHKYSSLSLSLYFLNKEKEKKKRVNTRRLIIDPFLSCNCSLLLPASFPNLIPLLPCWSSLLRFVATAFLFPSAGKMVARLCLPAMPAATHSLSKHVWRLPNSGLLATSAGNPDREVLPPHVPQPEVLQYDPERAAEADGAQRCPLVHGPVQKGLQHGPHSG